jgi:hypothetical protein
LDDKTSILITTLPAGWNFPRMDLDFSTEVVRRYIGAVGPGSAVDGGRGVPLVPPAAVAAMCQKACLEVVHLPPECLHISQELEMFAPIEVGTRLSLSAVLESKTGRGAVSVIRVVMAAADDAGNAKARLVATMLVAAEQEL